MIARWAAIIAIISAPVFQAATANAMDVSHRRIIFEAEKKSETLLIKNTSNEDQTYSLGWQHYKMREVKGLERIEPEKDTKEIPWADSMLTVEPERLTVKPGEQGEVRLTVKNIETAAQGEYRTHLWVRAERVAAAADAEVKEKGTRLSMFPAISLPVFIRIGEMTAAAEIADLNRVLKEGGGEKLEMTLKRQGNSSVFGDFEFICLDGEKETMVKQVGGIAVYPEVSQRKLSFALNVPETMKDACKSLRVDYKSRPDDRFFKGALISSAKVE